MQPKSYGDYVVYRDSKGQAYRRMVPAGEMSRLSRKIAVADAIEEQVSFSARSTGRPNVVPVAPAGAAAPAHSPRSAKLRQLDESPKAFLAERWMMPLAPRRRDGSSRIRPFKDTLQEKPARKPGDSIWGYEIKIYQSPPSKYAMRRAAKAFRKAEKIR